MACKTYPTGCFISSCGLMKSLYSLKKILTYTLHSNFYTSPYQGFKFPRFPAKIGDAAAAGAKTADERQFFRFIVEVRRFSIFCRFSSYVVCLSSFFAESRRFLRKLSFCRFFVVFQKLKRICYTCSYHYTNLSTCYSL